MQFQDQFLKDTYREWVRSSTHITDVIGDLEKEIARMREKKLPENIIDQKDSIIERLVDFYNLTDQILCAYRTALVNKQAEIMILDDCLQHAIRSEYRDRILKRLVSDVNELKERRELKQQLIDKVNA